MARLFRGAALGEHLPMAVAKQRRILVTGTGRSGTVYTSRVLRALGLDATHESIYGPRTKHPEWPAERQAEVSWMAVPFLGHLPPGTLVVHQVRDPIEVARSFLGRVMFHHGDDTPYSRFLAAHEPAIFRPQRVPVRFMRYYVRWNLRVQPYADLRVRLEDLGDPRHFAEMLAQIGIERSHEEIAQALDEIEPRPNAGPREETHRWDNLPSGKDLEKFVAMAVQFGYDAQD